MSVKVGGLSLGMVIPLILLDKGPMTKGQCFEIFKPLEITNREFDEAWQFCIDWGHIVPDFYSDDDNMSVYAYRADYNISNYTQYLPRVWDAILGDTPVREYTVIVTCKELHRDRILDGIRKVPGLIEAKYKNTDN